MKNYCTYCTKEIENDVVLCLDCSARFRSDPSMAMEIATKYVNFIGEHPEIQKKAIMVGLPETILPYNRVVIKTSMQIMLLAINADVSKNPVKEHLEKRDSIEGCYLTLHNFQSMVDLPFPELCNYKEDSVSVMAKLGERLKDSETAEAYMTWELKNVITQKKYERMLDRLRIPVPHD